MALRQEIRDRPGAAGGGGLRRRSPDQATGFAREGSGDRGRGPPQPSRLMGIGPPSSCSCHI